MGTNRCLYCGKELVTGSFCDTLCKYRVEKFEAKAERDLKWMVLLIIVSSCLIPVSLIFDDRYITLCFFILGLTFVIFPYATPETNSWRGVVTGIKIVRTLGAATCLASLIAYVLMI